MYWSLGALTAEVPLGVVTVTLTVPVPAGEVTVRLVAVTPLIVVPGLGPEVDGRGAGEVGAADRDRGPAGRWSRVGVTPVTVGSAGAL